MSIATACSLYLQLNPIYIYNLQSVLIVYSFGL